MIAQSSAIRAVRGSVEAGGDGGSTATRLARARRGGSRERGYLCSNIAFGFILRT
jgi:hypothetical protein